MTTSTLLAYLAALVIIIPTPGPSTLLAASHGMTYGVRRTSATIAGDLSANLLQIVGASVGIGAIIASSQTAFLAIKWAGVAYLAYLGYRKFRAPASITEEATPQRTARSRYTQGFVTSAANPKAVAFFAALFPQFLVSTAPLVPQVLLLGGIYLITDGASLTLWSSGGERLQKRIMNSDRPRLANQIAGLAMMVGAGLLALKGSPDSAAVGG